MRFQAVVRPRPELYEIPTRLGHTHHRHVEMTALDHPLQSGEDFFIGQIASGAEEDEGVRM